MDAVSRAVDTIHRETDTAVLNVQINRVIQEFLTSCGVQSLQTIHPRHGSVGIRQNKRFLCEVQATGTGKHKVCDMRCLVVENDTITFAVESVHVKLDIRGFSVVAEITIGAVTARCAVKYA